MQRRRRSAPHTFEENIAAEKAKLEAQIATLKPGPQMDALRTKIRQLDTAAHMSEWLSSPAPRIPKLDFTKFADGTELSGLPGSPIWMDTPPTPMAPWLR